MVFRNVLPPIYIIQGIISKCWFKYYLYGPLEWL
ncbi:MAG: DUF418 domain-containing protein [Reichenbachiella sp.]